MSRPRLTLGVALFAFSWLGASCTHEKPAPLRPPRARTVAFVLGTENKNGTHEDFEDATECEVNLRQFTAGWCGDWQSWEQSGCGPLPEAGAFFAGDPLRAVELSLAPWPHGLPQQSYGACARGEYDGHYESFARSRSRPASVISRWSNASAGRRETECQAVSGGSSGSSPSRTSPR